MLDLVKSISRTFGTTAYRVIFNGQELCLQEMSTSTSLSKLGIVDSCSLTIQKRESSTIGEPFPMAISFENRIQSHFIDFLGMLELPAPQGELVSNDLIVSFICSTYSVCQVLQLLRKLGVESRAKQVLMLDAGHDKDLLPIQYPFKTSFKVHAMSAYVDAMSTNVSSTPLDVHDRVKI